LLETPNENTGEKEKAGKNGLDYNSSRLFSCEMVEEDWKALHAMPVVTYTMPRYFGSIQPHNPL